MKSVTADYSKRLADEPGKGHNRRHEAIAPVVEAAPYAICSVSVDLKLSELVDVPNMVVSAFLPLDIFGQ